jgi:hypothetical protein
MVSKAQKYVGERPAAKAGGLGKGVLPTACSALGILQTGRICFSAALQALENRPGFLRACVLHKSKSAYAISTVFMSL